MPQFDESGALTLVIGTRRYSSWSLRPYLALKAAGAIFDEVEIALRQPTTGAAIAAHSPSGKVPVLRHGTHVVWDSLAICEYVAELFPEAGLWPQDSRARSVARSVSAEMHAGFPTLRSACSMDMCVTTPLDDVSDALGAEIARIDALWADCRARFGQGGSFLFGAFTIADAMYAPVVSRITTYRLPISKAGRDYCDAVWALPAMIAWRDTACA